MEIRKEDQERKPEMLGEDVKAEMELRNWWQHVFLLIRGLIVIGDGLYEMRVEAVQTSREEHPGTGRNQNKIPELVSGLA